MRVVTWSAVATVLHLLSMLCTLGDATFLAPCLWRRARSLPTAALTRTRRFLTTDADACSSTCRIPLFPASVCQRCCQAAGLPVPNPLGGGSGGLLGNLGLTGTAGPTQPMLSLSQLQALLVQLLAAGGAGSLRPAVQVEFSPNTSLAVQLVSRPSSTSTSLSPLSSSLGPTSSTTK